MLPREVIIIKVDSCNDKMDGDLSPLHLLSYKTRGFFLSESISFHPNNECIAFGDGKGGVHIWRDFASEFEGASQWGLSFLKQDTNPSNVSNRRNGTIHKRPSPRPATERMCGSQSIAEWYLLLYQSDDPRKKANRSKSREIFVGNIPVDVTEDNLSKLFASFGTIESVDLRTNRPKKKTVQCATNLAFIRYQSAGGAKRAIKEMHDKWIEGPDSKRRKAQKGIPPLKVAVSKRRKASKGNRSSYLMRRVHWHSHQISALTFTGDGAYLVSGGEESVLMMMHLTESKRQFMPRLGGPITAIAISPDDRLFAVAVGSNQIRIVDPVNQQVKRTLEGIGLCQRIKPITVQYQQHFCRVPHHRDSYIVPSAPGCIQWYNLKRDCSEGSLSLMPYIMVSRAKEKEPDRYVAQFMQWNHDGTRLATVLMRSTRSVLGSVLESEQRGHDRVLRVNDLPLHLSEWQLRDLCGRFGTITRCDVVRGHGTTNRGFVYFENAEDAQQALQARHKGAKLVTGRNDEMDTTEQMVYLVVLQLWHYNPRQDTFKLNTTIESPHNCHSIRGLDFHPTKNQFVSYAHGDHHFRIWAQHHSAVYLRPKDAQNDKKQEEQRVHATWKSLMTGYYQQDAVTAAMYTVDGTVLVVAAGNVLTLWNSQSLMLLMKMEQSTLCRSMSTFDASTYILAVHERDVVIWNLVKFSVHWSLSKIVDIDRVYDAVITPKALSFVVCCRLKTDGNSERQHLFLCDLHKKFSP